MPAACLWHRASRKPASGHLGIGRHRGSGQGAPSPWRPLQGPASGNANAKQGVVFHSHSLLEPANVGATRARRARRVAGTAGPPGGRTALELSETGTVICRTVLIEPEDQLTSSDVLGPWRLSELCRYSPTQKQFVSLLLYISLLFVHLSNFPYFLYPFSSYIHELKVYKCNSIEIRSYFQRLTPPQFPVAALCRNPAICVRAGAYP